jgi:hypothetical protein
MAGLEPIIRPFIGVDVAPKPFRPGNSTSAPPVRLSIGIIGGSKTFSFSNSVTMSSYMAAVHTEKSTPVFDMSTGKLV